MKILFDERETVKLKYGDYMWEIKKREFAEFLEKESNTSQVSLIERYFILGYLPMIDMINILDIENGIIEVEKPKSIKMEIREEIIRFLKSKR